jgi:hypothetical protein
MSVISETKPALVPLDLMNNGRLAVDDAALADRDDESPDRDAAKRGLVLDRLARHAVRVSRELARGVLGFRRLG